MRIKRILMAMLITLACQSNLTLAGDDVYKVSGYVHQNGLHVYKKPTASSAIVTTIPANTSWIKIQGNPQAGWQKIAWNGQQGWVKAGTLDLDRAATGISDGRVDCMHDPAIKNKTCCGIVEVTNDPSELVKIYSVTGVSRNDLLSLNVAPGRGKSILSLLPHNATWIVKLDESRPASGSRWEKIKWGGVRGWIDGRKIQYSPELTRINDAKRKACNVPIGCAPDLSALDGNKI